MRPIVLYIDDHRDYQRRLTRRLQSLSGDAYEIIAVQGDEESVIFGSVDALAREALRRITVTICPRHLAIETLLDRFHALNLHIYLCESGSEEHDTAMCASRDYQPKTSCEIRRDTGADNHGDEKKTECRTVSRFVRASQIDAMIRRYISSDKSSHDTECHHDNGIGMHLSFSHEMGTRVTRYVIGREQAHGHTVIYLPIKPLYKIEDRFRRSQGLTFGDLIYRFSVGDIPDISEMGRWLYMHEKGYYTCSMPERSDDLITCDINTLRQIVNAWRDYTHTRSQPTTTWIDMEGMPLGDVLAIAVLCDFLYVDAPAGNSDKEIVAQRELGLFMAKLPQECRILELPHRRRPIMETNQIC